MRWLCALIGILCLIPTAPRVSAQDQPSQTANPRPLKVCKAQNPPPCATAPQPLYTPDPQYSDKARKKKIHGKVILEFVVGTDGHTQDIHVSQPLGYGLDEQAVKSLSLWRFEPGTKDDKPVPVGPMTVEMDLQIY